MAVRPNPRPKSKSKARAVRPVEEAANLPCSKSTRMMGTRKTIRPTMAGMVTYETMRSEKPKVFFSVS